MKSPIEIRIVEHESAEWNSTIALRREILRKPLGLDFDPSALEAEHNDVHIAAYVDGKLRGCLVLKRIDDATVQMRQVAVSSNAQRGGIGSTLVRASEEQARALGYCAMILHARDSAIAFYERLGYEVVSEPYVEVGIAHRTMTKKL